MRFQDLGQCLFHYIAASYVEKIDHFKPSSKNVNWTWFWFPVSHVELCIHTQPTQNHEDCGSPLFRWTSSSTKAVFYLEMLTLHGLKRLRRGKEKARESTNKVICQTRKRNTFRTSAMATYVERHQNLHIGISAHCGQESRMRSEFPHGVIAAVVLWTNRFRSPFTRDLW